MTAAPSHIWRSSTFWLAQAVWWTVVGVGAYLQYMSEVGAAAAEGHILVKTVKSIAGVGVSSVLALGYVRLRAPADRPVRSAVILATASLTGGLLAYALTRIITGHVQASGRLFDPEWFLRGLLDHTWSMLAWSIAFVGIREIRRVDTRARAALDAERLAAEARYQALVYQVNPHFLFNALNSVRALVDEDAPRARTMITRLADFLRFTLQDSPQPSLPLGQELTAIAAYLEVEQIRFESRLAVSTVVSAEAAAVPVPAFLIAPLVENAITHGRGSPLEIGIHAQRGRDVLTVAITNTGTLGAPSEHRAGAIGLRNIRERLRYLYGDLARLALTEADGRVCATLTIPTTDMRGTP